MSSTPPVYRGRFAPTPSGPLHLGSLVTALGSYLCARAVGGRWLLRIDDLDTPRVVPGAVDRILRQLDAHGLHWDEPPRFQSDHQEAYAAALETLRSSGSVYACRCTRAELRQICGVGADEPIYPGRCRDAGHGEHDAALRLRLPQHTITLHDRWRGDLRRDLVQELGDFVLRRRDGQYAYQLASAVDEAAMGITEIIRGEDLIASSFRQAWLMQRLGLTVPQHGHLPLVLDAQGRKLSKQNHASAIDEAAVSHNLDRAFAHLGIAETAELRAAPPPQRLLGALSTWPLGGSLKDPYI